MKHMFNGVRRAFAPSEAKALSFNIESSRMTWSIIKQSPSLRLAVKQFQPSAENDALSLVTREYMEKSETQKLNLRVISDIFDHLTKTKHEIPVIERCLLSILASPRPIEAMFFTKGFFQSVTEMNSQEEQL